MTSCRLDVKTISFVFSSEVLSHAHNDIGPLVTTSNLTVSENILTLKIAIIGQKKCADISPKRHMLMPS